MTRKEKIERVAHRKFPMNDVLYNGLRAAFIDGVQWADQHKERVQMWRDLQSDPPEMKALCIFRRDDGYIRCGCLWALQDPDNYKHWFYVPKLDKNDGNTDE